MPLCTALYCEDTVWTASSLGMVFGSVFAGVIAVTLLSGSVVMGIRAVQVRVLLSSGRH